MPNYNDGTTSIPVRAASEQFPFYSFGSNPSPTGSGADAGEAIPAVATAGLQCAIPHTVNGMTPQNRTVTAQSSFPAGAPGAISWSIQGAMKDADAEYQSILGPFTSTSGEQQTINPIMYNFVRVKINSATPSGKTLVIKLLIS